MSDGKTARESACVKQRAAGEGARSRMRTAAMVPMHLGEALESRARSPRPQGLTPQGLTSEGAQHKSLQLLGHPPADVVDVEVSREATDQPHAVARRVGADPLRGMQSGGGRGRAAGSK